ncbi:MAG: hypothetical protein KDD37_06165 [Bdellovibrionales bacterium]|nr:hypothetical protein [Bdellovibrionales bacterium]
MRLAACLFLVWGMQAHAGGLSPSVDTETTSVLPGKIRTLRYKQYFVTVNDKFDADGTATPLGQSLNKKVTWNEVLAAQSGVKKDLLKASLQAQGIDINGEGPGSLTGEVNMNVNVKVPIIGYGINDHHSIGLIVPVYTIKTSVATSFVTSAAGEQWYKSIASPSTKAQIKEQLEGALSSTLQTYGYDPLQSEEVSALGDIRFVHKVLLGEIGDPLVGSHRLLWRNEIAAPTGRQPNADKVIDLATSDGQWDLGTGLNYEYSEHFKELNLPVSYALSAFYNYQMADSLERRIPIAEGSSISPDKEKVDRKLGDQISLMASASVGNGRDGSSLAVGYNYQYMFATKFDGSAYSSERYRWLEDLNQDAELQSMLVVYSYSTVDKFLNKSFPVPLTWTLSYAQPLRGNNVNDTRTYYTELQFFF